MTSYYDKEEDYSDYDLMPPEEGQRPRVPKGKRYPEKRAQIVNTKAFGFHPDEFKLALNSMRKGGKRLGSVFGFPDSGRGLKRKGPREGLSLWDRLNETRTNIKRPDDIVNCYVSGVETKERRQTFAPRYLEEQYYGKEKKESSGYISDDQVERVMKKMKDAEDQSGGNGSNQNQTSGNGSSASSSQEGQPDDMLSEFAQWASDKHGMDINAIEAFAVEFDTAFNGHELETFMGSNMDKCEGCGKEEVPPSWSGFCTQCSAREKI